MNKDYEWIKQCIGSCTDPWQLDCAKVLVSLFEKKHTTAIREADDLLHLATQKEARIGII